ncbi:MAG: hypothetical protein WD491_00070 [Balneolales bacterium]
MLATLLKKSYLFLLLLFAAYACDDINIGGGLPEPPYQTEILEVRVEPDTVAAGDSVRFTCVIKDSLDDRFIYNWVIRNVAPTSTESNSITIKAPDKPNTYSNLVSAYIPEQVGKRPNKIFYYEVIDKD